MYYPLIIINIEMMNRFYFPYSYIIIVYAISYSS